MLIGYARVSATHQDGRREGLTTSLSMPIPRSRRSKWGEGGQGRISIPHSID